MSNFLSGSYNFFFCGLFSTRSATTHQKGTRPCVLRASIHDSWFNRSGTKRVFFHDSRPPRPQICQKFCQSWPQKKLSPLFFGWNPIFSHFFDIFSKFAPKRPPNRPKLAKIRVLGTTILGFDVRDFEESDLDGSKNTIFGLNGRIGCGGGGRGGGGGGGGGRRWSQVEQINMQCGFIFQIP